MKCLRYEFATTYECTKRIVSVVRTHTRGVYVTVAWTLSLSMLNIFFYFVPSAEYVYIQALLHNAANEC